MTDKEIDAYEKAFDQLSKSAKPARVGNFIEIFTLRQQYLSVKYRVDFLARDITRFQLWTCEMLFVDGHFGPCCIWARGTMELMLQEDCLDNTDVPRDFKEQFYRTGDKNPKLIDMVKALERVGDWTDEVDIACRTLADNGNAVVHHRKDLLADGKILEDYLRLWKVNPDDMTTPGFKEHEQEIIDSQRLEDERRMALESLQALYVLFARRR